MTPRVAIIVTGLGFALILVGVGFFVRTVVNAPRAAEEQHASTGQVANTAPENTQPSPAQEVLLPPITLLFGGDLMFDRTIRRAARERGNTWVFSPELRALFARETAVIANLEGPITDQASRSEGSTVGSGANYVFTFDPSWAQTLHEQHIGPVNLGNNHILNFGAVGVASTRQYLEAAGVAYFGDPLERAHQSVVLTYSGVKVGLVNENQFVSEGEARALEDVRALRSQVDVLVAYAHWGTEYVPATADERRRAHALVDAGADVVIGSHPHVVQEREVYQNKTIYYSLGNLVFDQYWDAATRAGLLVEMHIDPQTKALSFRDISVDLLSSGQTVLSTRP